LGKAGGIHYEDITHFCFLLETGIYPKTASIKGVFKKVHDQAKFFDLSL